MLHDRLAKRAIWWVVAAAAVAVCVVLGWVFSREQTDDQSNATSRVLHDDAESVARQIEHGNSIAQDSDVKKSGPDDPTNRLDWMDVCSENSEELSEECMGALDSHFMQKPLVHLALSWVEFSSAPTYAEIFADPAGDRQRVFVALDRVECRLEEGRDVRVDLKDSCDAGAIARFSKLLDTCEIGGRTSDMFEFNYLSQGLHRLRIRNDLEFNNDGELDRRLAAERVLERRWKSEKCKELGPQLGLVRSSDTRQMKLLREMGERFGVARRDMAEDDERWIWRYAGILWSLADRLGAEETVSSTYRPFYGFRSTELKEHFRSTRPWLGPWERMMLSLKRKPDIRAAIDLVLSLRTIDVEFDLDHLIEMLCHPDVTDQTSCQATIDEVKHTINWSENQVLQVLDEFETRALELGLYD